jgi:uncharacterized protein YggT (Ycf19 family)
MDGSTLPVLAGGLARRVAAVALFLGPGDAWEGYWGPPWVSSLAHRIVRLIWFIFVLILSVIVLRLLFKALGAKDEGFVRFIYRISNPLVAPFRSIAADHSLPGEGGRVLEISSLIALLIIFLAVYLFVTLIAIIFGGPDAWGWGGP